MQMRKLGSELEVSALGLGCMGMNWAYGATDKERPEAIKTIQHALDNGLDFIDTADAYGPHTNEILVGEAIKGRRNQVILATKFGIIRGLEEHPTGQTVNGRPEYVKASCDGSLKRLGVDHIDLYYQHRVDTDVPIEETFGAMKELVEAGKVRFLGISEASSATIRRAHSVHPIAALQSEYSLWTRDLEENGILDTIRELGIGLVAYSPLGRGFLTGQIRSIDDLSPNDYRRTSPRFQGENFQKNLDIIGKIEEFAREKNVTAAQLALAWVLAQGKDIVPIAGTRKRHRLDENLGALNVRLTPQELKTLDDILPLATGARYPEATLKEVGL